MEYSNLKKLQKYSKVELFHVKKQKGKNPLNKGIFKNEAFGEAGNKGEAQNK